MLGIVASLPFGTLQESARTDVDSLIATAELVATLESARDANERHHIEFEVADYFGLGEDSPPSDLDPYFIRRRLCSLVFAGERFRFEHEYVEASEAASELLGRRSIHTWTGDTARSLGFRRNSKGEDVVEGRIATQENSDLVEEAWATCLGWRVAERFAFATLANLINQSHSVEGPTVAESGETKWVIRNEYPPNEELTLYAGRIDGQIRVSRFEKVLFRHDVPENSGSIQWRRMYHFGSEWSDAGIPKETVIVTQFFQTVPDATPWWGVSKILLNSVEETVASDGVFQLEMPIAAEVVDGRYMIAYTVGDNLVNVDGRLLRTAIPVAAEPGPELAKYIGEGKFIDPKQSSIRTQAREVGGWRLIPSLITTLGIFLAVLILWPAVKRLARVRALLFVPLVGALVNSCDEGSTSAIQQHDFGKVSLDEGPVVLTYTFQLKNDGSHEVEVIDVVPTCGCLWADVTPRVIPANGSASVVVNMQVTSSGAISHGVAVVLEEWVTRRFSLAAVGQRSTDFRLIPLSSAPDSPGLYECHAMITGALEEGWFNRVELLEPDGVSLTLDNWTILERGSAAGGRQEKSLASIRIDCTEYTGGFPVIVAMRDPFGHRATIRIGGDPSGARR